MSVRACGLALAACAACASAADFPVRPLRMIVPYAPGGNADIMARLIAQRLAETLRERSVLERRRVDVLGPLPAYVAQIGRAHV